MHTSPLILLVGEDRLTEQVCAELTATTGHRVRVVWALDSERQDVFRKLGASVTALASDTDEGLLKAGIREAASILTLSPDDGLNLSVALRARVLNPDIRLVLRLFDPVLGRKLEQNLANCTVLSPAAHAASTFAGGALDPSCLFAIRFRESDGPLVGFTQNLAADLGIGGITVSEAEARLQKRIVAVGERRTDHGLSARFSHGRRASTRPAPSQSQQNRSWGQLYNRPRSTRRGLPPPARRGQARWLAGVRRWRD